MASETLNTESNQGFHYRWSLDDGDLVQVDLRTARTISWGEAPLVVELAAGAGATVKSEYTIDAANGSFDAAAPAPDYWHENASNASRATAGTIKTVRYDDPITGLRISAAGGTGAVTLLSPVDLDGQIAEVT